MSEENKAIEGVAQTLTPKTRRAFVKSASQVAMTAPAVMLLLDATTKPVMAQAAYNIIIRPPVGDGTDDTDAGFPL